MKRSAFADTSAWYATVDPDDAYGAAATTLLRKLVSERASLITTNQVVGESHTLLRSRLGHTPAGFTTIG